MLDKLKQPQVIALIVMIIVQVAARFGYNFDNATVQSDVEIVLNILTAITGLWVAHKSEKGSII